MTIISVCQKLAASGYASFNKFDMNNPEAGGLKLSSLRALVQELMEELGGTKHEIPSVTDAQAQTVKDPVSTPKKGVSTRSNKFDGDQICEESGIIISMREQGLNLQSEVKPKTEKLSDQAPMQIIPMQPLHASPATSQLSEYE